MTQGKEDTVKARQSAPVLIAIGVIGLIGSILPHCDSSSDTTTTALVSSNTLLGDSGSETESPKPKLNPAQLKKLREAILASDRLGQKALSHVDRYIEQLLDDGNQSAREKIEDAIGGCNAASYDLEELATAHRGEMSVLDTVPDAPGQEKPNDSEKTYAEAAWDLSQAYKAYANSLGKFLLFVDEPTDSKGLKKAKQDLKDADNMRHLAFVTLPNE